MKEEEKYQKPTIDKIGDPLEKSGYDLSDPEGPKWFAEFYCKTLVEDVIPFWLKNGIDQEHGGIMTALDRDGSILDTDKSVWF